MNASTTAARAAAARRRRRATPERGGLAPKDPCPTCGVELGQAYGATRRQVVLTGDRGVFLWRCPDCHQAWSERASTQVGSTTRSAPANA